MPYAQQLGRYQLLDRIAFGGMAEIFRAKTFDSQGNAHLVAIKRVLGHLTTDDDFLKMLVDEAKVSATLRHDNIARVYEFAHSGEEYFLAMEYVDGKDVRTLLDRHRAWKSPIPPEHVAWIAAEAATALHAAHTQRDQAGRALHIVHRDVSPSNVLCAYSGEIKLCDFGIAKATLTRTQTKTGVIKGKVKYMSPEQAMGRRLDHRSDLFSLGTVIYEMLTLQAPFTAPTEVELIFAVRDANKRDAHVAEPTVPVELSQIVNKLMSRSRSQRHQSGAELAEALREWLESYKPGYRRSHFGRFMRRVFAEEIERELRLLEEYVIGEANPEDVGENLIADALGDDADYSKFKAGSTTKGTRVGSKSSKVRHGKRPSGDTDLHAEQTRIFMSDDLEKQRLQRQETRLFDNRGARQSSEQTTGRVLSDDVPPKKEPAPQRTQTLTSDSKKAKFHEARTHIFDPNAQRRPRPKKPAPPPARKAKPDFDEDEETALPLSDDDLEPA